MAQLSGLRFTALCGDLPADTFAVVAFTHTETFSAPFQLELGVASHDPDLAAAAVLEQPVRLQLWQDDRCVRTFEGIVTAFSQGDSGHRRTRYSLTVRPPLWRLSLTHNSRIFQDQTVQAIVQTLLEERGVRGYRFQLRERRTPRNYCVQYRETDLNFIQRLLAEEGIRYHFDTGDQGSHLIFSDDLSTRHLGPCDYNATAGGTAPGPAVTTLQRRYQAVVADMQLKDYDSERPAMALQAQAHGEAGSACYRHYVYPGRFRDAAAGQILAQARLRGERSGADVITGTGTQTAFAAGSSFRLQMHPNPALQKDWRLVSVVHRGEQPQALEEEAGEGGATYSNRFQAVPAEVLWCPPRLPRVRIDGPQSACVVGPEGEEIFCDHQGRVKVQFPWDRRGMNDANSSCWLRVTQGWAGGAYGFQALPRVGHEVLVSFLDGDPDQPLVTGRTYNAINQPPHALPEHKTRTLLKTRTHKGAGFNELRFDDGTANEQIHLRAQKDFVTDTGHDRVEWIGNQQHLGIGQDRRTRVAAGQHLRIARERREKLGQDYGLTVGGSLHLKVGKTLLSDNGQELHIKAGQKVVLEAGAEISVKAGGSFLKVDPSGVTLAGPQIRLNSGGSPGSGTGQRALAPLRPQVVDRLRHGVITSPALAPDQARAEAVAMPFSLARLQDLARQDLPLARQCHRQADGRCALGDACLCLQEGGDA